MHSKGYLHSMNIKSEKFLYSNKILYADIINALHRNDFEVIYDSKDTICVHQKDTIIHSLASCNYEECDELLKIINGFEYKPSIKSWLCFLSDVSIINENPFSETTFCNPITISKINKIETENMDNEEVILKYENIHGKLLKKNIMN